jgi:zinc transporter, ZIP family
VTAELQAILPYVYLATGAGIAGGVIASFWNPSDKARSAIQHFAAGVVIAVVASEVIPEAERAGTALGALGGFAAGGALMIGTKWFVLRFEKKEKYKGKLALGLAVAAAIDTLLDGAMISAGFITGHRLGFLLAVALALELFFLTLSVGAEFHKKTSRRRHQYLVTAGISLMIPVGAFAAYFLLQDASPSVIATVLAFGAAALIYLIAEELLVETILPEEDLFSTAMLFTGFLVLLALKLFSQKQNN